MESVGGTGRGNRNQYHQLHALDSCDIHLIDFVLLQVSKLQTIIGKNKEPNQIIISQKLYENKL